VIGAAERVVAEIRMASLVAAQAAARRLHIAAQGLVTRARQDGSAEKIAAAVKRERQAYADFMRVSDTRCACPGRPFVTDRHGLAATNRAISAQGTATRPTAFIR
jgi:hypothetical protein